MSIFTAWFRNEHTNITKSIIHGNLREYLWTLFPTVVLLLIAVPSIKLLFLTDASQYINEPIFTYKVVGHQWYWSYEYISTDESCADFDSYMLDSESVKSVRGFRLLEVTDPLIVPFNYPLRFLVTSVDVLHSWAVPSLGIKIDAVPGRLNQVCVIVRRVGEFYGQCSEICGINHGFMPIKIVAV